VVREASARVLGLRPFDVQLIGGMILHAGQIAEMRTGEGKTLVAVLPAYLNALSGKGVQARADHLSLHLKSGTGQHGCRLPCRGPMPHMATCLQGTWRAGGLTAGSAQLETQGGCAGGDGE
jgi:hypothetical protein